MKHSDAQKYALFLKKLTTDQIDTLLSTILGEMRRRDSDHVKGDVLANSKALRRWSSTD